MYNGYNATRPVFQNHVVFFFPQKVFWQVLCCEVIVDVCISVQRVLKGM